MSKVLTFIFKNNSDLLLFFMHIAIIFSGNLSSFSYSEKNASFRKLHPSPPQRKGGDWTPLFSPLVLRTSYMVTLFLLHYNPLPCLAALESYVDITASFSMRGWNCSRPEKALNSATKQRSLNGAYLRSYFGSNARCSTDLAYIPLSSLPQQIKCVTPSALCGPGLPGPQRVHASKLIGHDLQYLHYLCMCNYYLTKSVNI
jgi:hypothetical protein